jgi:hypothetical protein
MKVARRLERPRTNRRAREPSRTSVPSSTYLETRERRERYARGERELAAFRRGEGSAPGFERPCTMPVDPTAVRQAKKTARRR